MYFVLHLLNPWQGILISQSDLGIKATWLPKHCRSSEYDSRRHV